MATPIPPEAVHLAATAAAQAEPSVLGAFGVTWKTFIAQLTAFAVVVFVMWKWVYTPLLKTIDARKRTIDAGLADAEAAVAARAGAERESEASLASARREAMRIIEEAQQAAEALKREMKDKTQRELAVLVAEGKAALTEEKTRIVREAKADIAELVTASAEKVLGEALDPKTHGRLIESAVKRLAS